MEDVSSRSGLAARLSGGSLAAAALLSALVAHAETVPQDITAATSSAIRQAQQVPAAQMEPLVRQITPPVIPALSIDLDAAGFVEVAAAGRRHADCQSRLLSEPGHQWADLLHLPSAGDRLDDHADQHAAALPGQSGHRPAVSAGRRHELPERQYFEPCGAVQGVQSAVGQGPDPHWPAIAATPTTAVEYQIVAISDPYSCNTSAATGLTNFGPSGATTGMVSVYRRPLPSTNLGFLSTVMWDGREASLTSQAVDATTGHAQAATPPTAAQQQDIVAFESGLYTAQAIDFSAGSLSDHGGHGGPSALSQQQFFIGINDPLSNNPTGAAFTSDIFNIYAAWPGPSTGWDPTAAYRASVARGEQVFNTKPITITGVAGLNDATGQPSIAGFCGTCHDSPNVGDHSVKAPLNIGVTDADPGPPSLDISDLPVFTLQCVSGTLAGQSFTVTDPGRALISGKCADIGKTKGPILRGLASRAPYFHNGSGTTLQDVVNFYDQRFSIGFSAQEKQDLVNFLNTI
ncbi:MAG: hypothetical protein WDN69_01845 [Aliidongia sp.]